MIGDPRLPERFWSKVIVEPNDCWAWQAAIHRKGYGQFYFGGSMAQAHRVCFEALVGRIADGAQLDHTCHNRSCVNPAHLHPVSPKENAENRVGGNANSLSGIRGVHRDQRVGKWYARVHHDGRTYYGPRTADLKQAERDAIEIRNRLFSNNLIDRVAS